MALIKANISSYQTFLKYLMARIGNNKNALVICTGPTGSGKSYTQLRMSEDLDDSFNINKVSFGPEQFMAVINSGNLKKKGSASMYDEAGVTFNSRNWYSVSNKMLHYFLQTCRSQNQILFFNAPDFSFLDSGARKLFHIHLQTAGIDYDKKVINIKPLCMQISQSSGKVYKKYLRVRVHSGYGGIQKIERIKVPLPSKELMQAYEDKKDIFIKNLNKEIYDTIKQGNRKSLTDKQQRWYDLYQLGQNVEQIAEKEGYSIQSSYKHREYILNKGYSLEK